ncbi:RagB/SusD family nutrient uptake outer membrane protein [Arachidicoccus sp.]|uniref:RagB/SusD family nutrient uptake outer membrane protein n=1 Tax=Arachidicoccus sp. TaxID=1872624 RepID=UPI003D23C11D
MKYKIHNYKIKKTRSRRNLMDGAKQIALMVLFVFCCASCKKSFLNVVPDNIATIDNAFTSKVEAEKYLMTCYSYMPIDVDPTYNVGLTNGDEVWIEDNAINMRVTNVVELPRGGQNTSNPIANYWDGTRDANANFKAIRDCNIFIENVSDRSKIPDLDIDTRIRWIAEAQFLKAFYHFILFRAYGPIPIIDKNLPINAPLAETQVKRQPVDSVVNYISNLLDSAAVNLPASITNTASELGRITKPIALSLKAKLLVTAASPLFNGNSDYNAFKDKDGTLLFNATYSVTKWQRAAAACKAAIDLCAAQGISLYVFPQQTYALSDTTMTQMSIRNSMSEPWNSELIWGLTTNNVGGFNSFFQRMGAAPFDRTFIANGGITYGSAAMGPTIKCAEMFYTKNGVPIDEDKTLNFSNISELRVATHDERFNIKEGEITARLNFDREPRFYADLGFDRSIWYMANSPSKTDENTFYLFSRAGEFGQNSPVPICGYFMKKIVNWHMDWNTGTFPPYPYPEMRLAGLYLLYAEALNEANPTPTADVYKYINLVRARAGLNTVQYSWDNYSTNPGKYKTQSGMRSIIQRERSIELCFEGDRYWDLLRWKRAATELTGNITGWDRTGRTPDLYYRQLTYYTRHFVAPRDYLFPIEGNDLLNDPNLVQNPNW